MEVSLDNYWKINQVDLWLVVVSSLGMVATVITVVHPTGKPEFKASILGRLGYRFAVFIYHWVSFG